MKDKRVLKRVEEIATDLRFSQHLGFELVSVDTDEVTLRLPYVEHVGIERVNGGAISALVDTASTCAFWANEEIDQRARGATVGFSINFLRLAKASDLWAHATVRRRGGSLCVGEVTVTDAQEREIAFATVTYKLGV